MTVKLIKDNDYVIVESGSVGEKRWKQKGYKPEESESEKPDTKDSGSGKNPKQGKKNPDSGKVKSEQTGSDDKSEQDKVKPGTQDDGSEQIGSDGKSGSKATDGNDKN